jgi:carbon-monoxide dehydrogenase large subunit
MRTANSLIGSPVERIEDLRFLRGRGEFVDDVVLDGVLHAAILRSSVAHGHIRSIDCKAALARPGVRAVITAADIKQEIGNIPVITLRQELLEEFKRYQQPVIAHEKVRYVGEPIAILIAESAAAAEDALEAIAVDIERLPVVADRDAARRNEVLLFDKAGSNRATTLTALRGDAQAAFDNAPYVRRERFSVQRFTAVPMESRGLLATWDAVKGDFQFRHCKGHVPQSANSCKASEPAGNLHYYGGAGCRASGFGVRGGIIRKIF